MNELERTIKCELCGKICRMQVSASHLKTVHGMTTKEYRALGYQTLSPARLEQLRESPVGQGTVKRLYGAEHPGWKGGHLARSGYKIVSKMGKRLQYEHRVVAEQTLGRPLEADEVVHHRDGNRSNNDPSNLVVMKRAEHDKDKTGAQAYFHTGPECVEAAKLLRSLGWSKLKIQLALRVHHGTLDRWLKS